MPSAVDEKVYLSTDRYLYEPEEKLLFSAFVHRYSDEGHSNRLKIWLEDTKGKTLDSVYQFIQQKSSAVGYIRLPRKGGMYYLKAKSLRQNSFAKPSTFSKEIFVQSYHGQSVSLRLETDKKNYSSEEEVTGFLKCQQPGGMAMRQNKVILQLMQNGKVIQEDILHSDEEGKVYYKLKLPAFKSKMGHHFYVLAKTQFRGSPYVASKKLITEEKPIVSEAFFEHGNEGYIAGRLNKVVLKTTDKRGNPYDISGSLVNSRNEVICHFSPFKNGLTSFTFIPKREEQYRLVRKGETLMYLGKAQADYGIAITEMKKFVQAKVISGNPAALVQLRATFNNQVIYSDYLTSSGFANIKIEGKVGVMSIQLIHDGIIVARRLYFLGWEGIKPLKSNLDKNIYLKDSLLSLQLSHPSMKRFRMSVALVKESNINQMKNKSHDVTSWIYLGSEFNNEISEPQYYFDKDMPKAKEALKLLMNTQSKHWIKDFNSGKVIMQYGHDLNGELVITGKINHYNEWGHDLKVKNVKVYLTNSSIEAITDGHGNFQLIIPDNYGSSSIGIQATNGSLKTNEVFLNVHNLYNAQQDFKNGIKKRDIPWVKQPIPAVLPLVAMGMPLLEENIKYSDRRASKALPISSKTITTGASRSPGGIVAGTIAGVNHNSNKGLSFVGSRSDGTAVFVNDLIVMGASRSSSSRNSEPSITFDLTSVAGINPTSNGSLSFVGSRPEATAVYVDGVRVKSIGSVAITGNRGITRDCGFSGTTFYMGSTSRLSGMGTIGYEGMPFFANTSYPSTNLPRHYTSEWMALTVRRNYHRKSYSTRRQPPINKKFTALWRSFVQSDENGKVNLPLKGLLSAGAYFLITEGLDQLGKPVFFKKRLELRDQLAISYQKPSFLYLNDEGKVQIQITNYSSRTKDLKILLSNQNGHLYKVLETAVIESDSTALLTLPLNAKTTGTKRFQFTVSHQDRMVHKASFEVSVLLKKESEQIVISGDSSQRVNVNLSDAEKGTAQMRLRVFHNMNQQVTQMAARLVRQPYGCFEQVSSANYPNLIALQNMQLQKNVHYSEIQRAKAYIRRGYHKLVGYETPQKGFEWYGRNPPHQALTAYGLLQFHLMKQLNLEANPFMFRRNLDWLWSQRDQKGGFKYSKGKYGFSGANYAVNNAYITYVLARISDYDLNEQLKALERSVQRDFDGYEMSLLANALLYTKDTLKAKKYLFRLNRHFVNKGYEGIKAKRSFVYSYGKSLDLEILGLTLQLAVHLGEESIALPIRSKILESVNSRGYFGNTQATALCLEALNEFALYSARANQSTQLQIILNGKNLVKYDFADQTRFIELPCDEMKYGVNSIKVLSEGRSIPYQLEISYAPKEMSKIHSSLALKAKLPTYKVEKGSYVPLNLSTQNQTQREMGQVVISVGIPACFTLPTEELRQAVKQGDIDYYEIKDDELHLYLLGLQPGEKKSLSLNLRADIHGIYGFKSATIMEYYQPEVHSKVVLPNVHVL